VPASPLALVSSLPTRIRIRVGAPLAPETLFGVREESGAEREGGDALTRALTIVEQAVTQVLTRSAARDAKPL
jgi:hypothetical protein